MLSNVERSRYNGMQLWGGYGMQYVHNMVHHSLEVPGLHSRGGIYFDGHQQATSNVTLNVMYKAAGRALLVNGAPRTNVTRNLIVNSGVGKKTALFEPFIYKMHYFAKTGSGQT